MRPQHTFALATALVMGIAWPCGATGATLTVTTSVDAVADGDGCSLREAIINANNDDQSGSIDCPAGAGADRIEFAPATDGVPIQLLLSGPGAGDLVITDALTVAGNGFTGLDPRAFDPASARTLIDASSLGDRVFASINVPLTLEGVALLGGGGVAMGGALQAFSADVIVRDCVFVDNTATSIGGAISFSATDGPWTLTVENSLFTGNQVVSSSSAQGGALLLGLSAGASATIQDSAFVGNSTDGDNQAVGGAIASYNGLLTIQRSVFESNQATAQESQGGAIYSGNGTLTVASSSFLANVSQATGLLALGGAVTLVGTLDGSWIDNSTFTGNSAVSPEFAEGGAIAMYDFTGASGYIDLGHVTIVDNLVDGSSGLGGGVFLSDDPGIRFRAANTLIAGNFTGDGGDSDCLGALESIGYTLIGDRRQCSIVEGPGDQIGDGAPGGSVIPPLLDQPADNGSPILVGGWPIAMPTRLPMPGSPAVDRASPVVGASSADCALVDQRGVTRPIDGDADGDPRCDIGAVEAPPATYRLVVAIDDPAFGAVTSLPAGIDCPGVDCSFDFENGAGVTLTATTSVDGQFFGWGGNCTGTGACGVSMDGDQRVIATFGGPDAVFANSFE